MWGGPECPQQHYKFSRDADSACHRTLTHVHTYLNHGHVNTMPVMSLLFSAPPSLSATFGGQLDQEASSGDVSHLPLEAQSSFQDPPAMQHSEEPVMFKQQ